MLSKRGSWWQLGEGVGHWGSELALHKIECAFCNEAGNLERVFRGTKKKPGSDKRLNFDVYKCNNCAGYVHVVWSASAKDRSLDAGCMISSSCRIQSNRNQKRPRISHPRWPA